MAYRLPPPSIFWLRWIFLYSLATMFRPCTIPNFVGDDERYRRRIPLSRRIRGFWWVGRVGRAYGIVPGACE